jgi:hypothetical protein
VKKTTKLSLIVLLSVFSPLSHGQVSVGVEGTGAVGGGNLPTIGSFEAPWNGCTTIPSQTINYWKFDGLVILQPIDDFGCISNSTAFRSLTSIPAELRPTEDRIVGIFHVTDNSVDTAACAWIRTTGTIDLMDIGTSNYCPVGAFSGTSWVASGNKLFNKPIHAIIYIQ